MLRGSAVRRGCIGDHIDLLFAFDNGAIRTVGPRVADEGVVIFDSSIGPAQHENLAPGMRVIEIPFGRLAVRDLRRDLFKNSLGFGVVAGLLSLEDDEAIDTLRHRFARQPDRVIDANVDALKSGSAFADELGLTALNGPWVLGAWVSMGVGGSAIRRASRTGRGSATPGDGMAEPKPQRVVMHGR